MSVTQQQSIAKHVLETAITNFYVAMAPTEDEKKEAENWYIDDVVQNGASDLQIANYAYDKRTGDI